MNGVANVIYVNMTMSCLYQIVLYMYSMYPPLWTIKKRNDIKLKWVSMLPLINLAYKGL